MKSYIGLFIGLLLSVSSSAESLLEGRVRLESGQPAVGVQVRLFDLTNLHQSVGTTTDETGHFTLSLPAAAPGSALPQGFALGQNYPNPFNPSTIIPYQIPTAAHVRLAVFNLLGQRIATLVDREQAAGAHTATWTATDETGRAVGAGVYIYRLVSGGATVSRRMVLIDGQAGTPAAGAASVVPGMSGDEAGEQAYGLVVAGPGIAPYVVRDFRVEAGMAPVEVVVEAHPAGKALGDDCDLCDLLDLFNNQQQEEAEQAEPDSTSNNATSGPDLIVLSPSVSDSTLTPGQPFTLRVTVQNQGDQPTAATTLRYYRSNNATITASDTQVGTTAAIGELTASATHADSIALTAPTEALTHFYGACVEPVADESNTDNNCSTAVRMTVSLGQDAVSDDKDNDERLDGDGEGVVSFSEPQIYNDNVFVLPLTEDLRDGEYGMDDLAVRFYEYFSDTFDFLIFLPSLLNTQIAPEDYTFSAFFDGGPSNDVKGIGLSSYFSSIYGSAGKLQGVIYFRTAFNRWDGTSDYSDILFSDSSFHIHERSNIISDILPHELMHRWANYIVPSINSSHWGLSSADGVLGGFDITTLAKHENGRYSAQSKSWAGFYAGGGGTPYSPIELYLAGLIPPEEVPDLWVAENGELFLSQDDFPYYGSHTSFTANRIKKYTIEDIIAEHGPRIPNHTQSQKNFRAAVILLISEDYPADTRVLDILSEDVALMSYAGYDQYDEFYNFYEATGGQATLTTDGLSSLKHQGAAKRPVPSSYGTPPPIVDCYHGDGPSHTPKKEK